jgi:hypothetical protein
MEMSVSDMLDEMRKDSAKKGPSCAIGLTYTRLAVQEQTAFKEAMKDETIQSTAIARWLGQKGYSVKPHTMSRHRRGQCGCER